MQTIREFDPEKDWSDLLEFRNRMYPDDPVDKESVVERERFAAESAKTRKIVLEEQSKVIGAATLRIRPGDEGLAAWAGVYVPLDDLKELRFSTLLNELVQRAAEADCATILVFGHTKHPTLVDVAKRLGFDEVQRNPVSALDTSKFREAEFAGSLEQAKLSGYVIRSLAEHALIVPDRWILDYWELENRLLAEVPQPTPFVEIPYGSTEKQLTSDRFSREGVFLAMHGESVVGMTEIRPNWVDPRLGSTGLTGVDREHRRRGLATALKTSSLQWAKSVGITRIATDNEASNPMLGLNRRMGFEFDYEMIMLVKRLAPAQ